MDEGVSGGEGVTGGDGVSGGVINQSLWNQLLEFGKPAGGAAEGGGGVVSGAGNKPNLQRRLRELWNEEFVREMSMLPNVKGVTAIGCVLAVEVEDGGSGGGYSSGAAREIVLKLRVGRA